MGLTATLSTGDSARLVLTLVPGRTVQLWVFLVPSPHVTHIKKKKRERDRQTDKQSDREECLENVNTTKILLGVVERETHRVKK